MTLTIGIPSRGINPSLYRVIEHALSLEVDEIVVGINPTGREKVNLLKYSDPRLKIHFHSRDLGLYGNFRFLAQESHSTYFSWLCTDDALSPDVPMMLKSFEDSSINLIIPSWVWVEYHPQDAIRFELSTQVPGTYPDMKTNGSAFLSALHSEPSWIFGVWRTEYLQNIFPRCDFDWLDTHLLQKVLLTGKVSVVSVPTPTLIGTWHWANKVPNSVSQKGHNPTLAIIYQLLLLPRQLSQNPKLLWAVLLRIRFLIASSRSMNKRIYPIVGGK